jgi:leucyl/phenylalanyl-tRNA--protein transferase
LRTFGAVEVPKRRYHRLLEEALIGDGDFAALALDQPMSGEEALATIFSGQ